METPGTVRPAESAEPAQWLMADALDNWFGTTEWGPRGFAAYARVDFRGDSGDGMPDTEDSDLYERVMDVLSAHTSTAEDCYVALWEGRAPDETPTAPLVPIPERGMYLYRCVLDDVVGSVESVWPDGFITVMPPLTWPADHAWCVAVDIDQELAFTVACSEETYAALVAALPDQVRRAAWGDPEPKFAEDPARPAQPIDPRGLGEPVPPGDPGFMRYAGLGLLGGFGIGGLGDGG